jgi:hypothetical protein
LTGPGRSIPRGSGLERRDRVGRRKGIFQRFVEGFLAGAPLGISVVLAAGRLTAGFLIVAHSVLPFRYSVIPKSGYRFSEKITLNQ